ncbi:9b3d678d-66f6-4ea6-9ede-4a920b455c57-CDS [Sclerotinia trifoliorum]|uniref:9b3d678d-66f6-4ea6-9ede-4a920b455c57-CDS n=1 Tax=Sclerotinia trifoliorum TaxID=28548 RepID=A0A8H2VXB9_9HELO|nr:9b3d678d-66f6-4ea6-9ede-4a920b455c57-CDS [Sclerotinia trifoliorum]
MPLLNCIRENIKARAERKRQAINEINNSRFENEDTSSGNVVKQNTDILEEATSSEERTFGENLTSYNNRLMPQHTSNIDSRVTEESFVSNSTSASAITNHETLSNRPLQSTTLRGPALNNDLSEDHDSGDAKYDDSSTESPSPVSKSHVHSNMSSCTSITRSSSPQTNGLRRQWMNNRRRNNHRFIPNSNNNLSLEHHDNFGAPLERVNARQRIPTLSTETQDQVDSQVVGNFAQPHSGFEGENPDCEDAWANDNRPPTSYLAPVIDLPQAPILHPQLSPPQNPHRQTHVHRAIVSNRGPNNPDF